MLKDIPYSELTKDKRSYEIMLLRDQYGNTFSDIAKDFELSITRTTELYHNLKRKQIRLYINHISVVLGEKDTSQLETLYWQANKFYKNWTYACAYLEKKYNEILTEYRAGEPGMPAQFIKKLPPLRTELSKKTISRVIEMRETEKASFIKIAKKLHITPEKAERIYESYYYHLVSEHVKVMQRKTRSKEEKNAIWEYYFNNRLSSKTRYEIMKKNAIKTPEQAT